MNKELLTAFVIEASRFIKKLQDKAKATKTF
jgi:hypothetical protein